MPLRTAYRQTSDGIRVPYQAVGETNHGFIDLRGRPGLARGIAEAAGSRALRKILVRLAAPGSAAFSLGCDLGSHEATAAPAPWRQVAGGYLHVIGTDYAALPSQAYHAFAKSLEVAVNAQVGKRNWQLAFLLQDVELQIDDGAPFRGPSLGICFYASAPNRPAALHSREALIEALDAALAPPLALTPCGG